MSEYYNHMTTDGLQNVRFWNEVYWLHKPSTYASARNLLFGDLNPNIESFSLKFIELGRNAIQFHDTIANIVFQLKEKFYLAKSVVKYNGQMSRKALFKKLWWCIAVNCVNLCKLLSLLAQIDFHLLSVSKNWEAVGLYLVFLKLSLNSDFVCSTDYRIDP